MSKKAYFKKYMSDQAGILSKLSPDERIISAKKPLGHSYTF